MKKNILLLLVTLSFIMPLQAQLWNFGDYCCGRNFYGKILTVANFLQDTSINGNTTSYKPGYIIGASLGYRLNCGFSLEA